MFLLLTAIAVLLLVTQLLKKSLLVSASSAFAVVTLILVASGRLSTYGFISSLLHGLLVAVEVGSLIFGAFLFYNYLKAAGFIERLGSSLRVFTQSRLIVAIVLAFFFGGFIEGVSGFGTPAMIIAPLLLGLRFPVYIAAALPLLANTVPVVFGAVGTPIKVGLADLATEPLPFYAALIVSLPAILIPVVVKRLLENGKVPESGAGGLRAYFIAVSAGVCFAVPFIFFSCTGVSDLTSIAASLTGLVVWLLIVSTTNNSLIDATWPSVLKLLRTFGPYLFVALLLVAGKMLLGDTTFVVAWPEVGLEKLIHYFQPGLIFVVGLFVLLLIQKGKPSVALKGVLKQTAGRLPEPLITIALLAVLARLLSQNLDVNELGSFESLPVPVFHVLAVMTGFLGSFIAGSATVSNLMFGPEWYAVGHQFHLNISLLLASQLAGAALGNALSMQNIAMVQAVLNEKELEIRIFGELWKPVILFFLCICFSSVVLSLM